MLKRAVFHVLTVFVFLGAIGLGTVWYLSRDLPSLEQLENYDPDLVTRIFSSDGVLLKELYTQRRVFVDLEEIPEELISAAVASEDIPSFPLATRLALVLARAPSATSAEPSVTAPAAKKPAHDAATVHASSPLSAYHLAARNGPTPAPVAAPSSKSA